MGRLTLIPKPSPFSINLTLIHGFCGKMFGRRRRKRRRRKEEEEEEEVQVQHYKRIFDLMKQ